MVLLFAVLAKGGGGGGGGGGGVVGSCPDGVVWLRQSPPLLFRG